MTICLKIQTKFEKIKNSLQKKSEIIRQIIELIMIRIRIYAMRINEVKIEHIDMNNQFNVIKYLSNVNASLHSNLIIKKMSWSFRVIRNKKRYFMLHMKIIIIKMINRMFFENFMKIFEIKKCEWFIKNCILRQCFNCQKYEHIKNIVESSSYAKNASWNIISANTIRQSLKNIKCAKRAKIVNTSHDRRSAERVEKKKQKTKHIRQTRMRLYLVSESQIVFNVFRFIINSSTTSFTISITNSKIILSKWKMIKIIKKMNVWNQTFFSNFHRLRDESSQKTI
jgi:hypothetical protein